MQELYGILFLYHNFVYYSYNNVFVHEGNTYNRAHQLTDFPMKNTSFHIQNKFSRKKLDIE